MSLNSTEDVVVQATHERMPPHLICTPLADTIKSMRERLLTIVETAPFPKQAEGHLSEDERDELVGYVARHPEAGDLIPGLGGVRKLRWARKGGGKRGGLRVIYYFYNENWPVFLLALYHKSIKGDLSPTDKQRLGKLVEILKGDIKKRSKK